MLPLSSPYFHQKRSVARVMFSVSAALIPAFLVHCYYFGSAIFIQAFLCISTALFTEAVFLKLHGKPVFIFISDGSAILTALLLCLALPPLSPYWLTMTATFFALFIGKHLYGGLGQNPFNPAMLGFAVAIVSWPSLMLLWPESAVSFTQSLSFIFSQTDAISSATPLDQLKTAQKTLHHFNAQDFGAWSKMAWLNSAYLLGGVMLCFLKRISWRLPVGFLLGIFGVTALAWMIDSKHFASPLFHLFSGGTMLGAFFIVTDPVSGCATPKGQWIFACLCGFLCAVIRLFGAYPDGIAFAVLLMNICAPFIERLTTPKPFGLKD